MAKRRSSTRLPRRPKLLASPDATDDASLVDRRIEYAPVVAMGKLLRRVHVRHSLQFIEEWNGEYWFPSSVPMHIAHAGLRATPEQLRTRGVPPEDWRLTFPSAVTDETPAPVLGEVPPSSASPGATPRQNQDT